MPANFCLRTAFALNRNTPELPAVVSTGGGTVMGGASVNERKPARSTS